MVNPELKALKRLIKKLSAVRQVLRNDEREWLDRFLIGDSPEVEGHSFIPQTKLSQPKIRFDSSSSTYVLEDEK